MLPLCAVAGRCGSVASASSEISCSHSQVFDELEAIAPRSTSCASLDDMSGASDHNSPDTGRCTNLLMGQEATLIQNEISKLLLLQVSCFSNETFVQLSKTSHILGTEVY